MEAAGLALAMIPLLISAVEDFGEAQSCFSQVRNYREEAIRLVRLFNAEHVRFRCTCEKLLQNVVPESEMRAMMRNPRRETWESIVARQSRSLESRLNAIFGPYIELFNVMVGAIEGLKKMLYVGPDGKVLWHGFNDTKDKYRAFYVVLRSGKFEVALNRVARYNNLLESLLTQHLELAPRRERLREKSFDLKRFQKNASCLFEVVQDFRTCKCVHEQTAFVRSNPSATHSDGPSPNNSDDSKFDVLLALKLQTPSPNEPWVWYDSVANISNTTSFGNLARSTNGCQLEHMDLVLQPCANDANTSTISQNRGEQQVRFQTWKRGLSSDPEEVMIPLSNIFPSRNPCEHRPAKEFSAQFDRRGRWILAINVASSVLQLCHTPWLRDPWDKCDMMIDALGVGGSFNHVYLSNGPNRRSIPPEFQREMLVSVVRNEALFTLGLVLVELCLGQTLEDMRISEDPTSAPSFLTYWKLARDRLAIVYNEAGKVYEEVMRRCIFCHFDTDQTTLEDDDFRQAAWNGVVIPLEEGLKSLW